MLDGGDLAALEREPLEVRLTAQFYAWERWGRGWQVWPWPVAVEPPFRPFLVHSVPRPARDDGRRSTILSRFVDALAGSPPEVHEASEEFETWAEEVFALPEPVCLDAGDALTELQVVLPEGTAVTPERAEQFLLAAGTWPQPMAFEVIGLPDAIVFQLAVPAGEVARVRNQLQAHFPEAVATGTERFLTQRWASTTDAHALIAEFGLADEFMCPLAPVERYAADPLAAVVGALGAVETGEVALLQCLVAPALAPWRESVMRSVTDGAGESFFLNSPEMVKLAAEKVGRPLFGACLRVAARSPRAGREMELGRGLAAALRQFGRPGSNQLIPLENDEYPDDVHEEDLLLRRSRRSGMLLNVAELASVAHLPSASVRHPRLVREARRSKAAPEVTVAGHGLVLGENVHHGVTRQVTIPLEARLRHTHIVGSTGTGKSTLLLSLIVQDIEAGQGVALLDPHGDLVDEVLARVPDRRQSDVVLVDPADAERPVGFNILQAHSELERTLLASDLVAVFRRLSTSWGDQMHSVFANAILAFLESDRGGTIADLRRFLVEAEFRKAFLETVRDPEIRYYWTREFPLLTGRPQAPILTRLDAFLRPRVVRAMVTARENKLDLARIMDDGGILLVKLAQGAIGEENAALLGSFFVAKIHQVVMGRQERRAGERRPFFLHIDEFQHFVTPSMATMLTAARKYGLGLVLAHQELRQLLNQDKNVAAAVLANAALRIVFRVGEDDAEKLAEGFSSFAARDLQNLSLGEAVCRLDRAEWDFNLRTAPLPSVTDEVRAGREAAIRAGSRERYGVLAAGAAPAARVPGAPDVATATDGASPASPPVDPRATRPRTGVGQRGPAPVSPPEEGRAGAVAPSGRGGRQHRYLQELVRRWAESKGYRVSVEKSVLGGAGIVDVILERGDRSIACEISVTTAAEHEADNVQKCLAAGYQEVFAIAVDKRTATDLADALATALTPGQANQVRVVSPDEFFQLMEAPEAARPEVSTVRGYRVSVKHGARQDDADFRGRLIAQTVVGALRRLKPTRGTQ